MTLDDAIKKLKEHKRGQFFWVDIQTDKTKDMKAEARNAGHTCYKFSHMQVRRGVDYENMASTKEKRAAGKAPQGRTWGVHSTDPEHEGMVIYHNGKIFLALEPAITPDTAINAKQVKYIVDGVEMDLSEVEDTGYFTPSKIKAISQPSNSYQTITLESIVNIY